MRRQRFEAVGVLYCVQHQGVANEDDERCDFAFDEPLPCNFRQLGWLKPGHDPRRAVRK